MLLVFSLAVGWMTEAHLIIRGGTGMAFLGGDVRVNTQMTHIHDAATVV